MIESYEMETPDREQKLINILHQIELRNGEEKEENGIPIYKVKDPEEFFNWATQNGCLLHGSPKLFQTLEPQKASDIHRDEGSLNAVYMAKNPIPSMAKTIIGSQNGGYSIKRDQSGRIEELEIYAADLSRLSPKGYMYIIDDKDFDRLADGDHVSFKSVNPYVIVEFTKDDFKYPIIEKK